MSAFCNSLPTGITTLGAGTWHVASPAAQVSVVDWERAAGGEAGRAAVGGEQTASGEWRGLRHPFSDHWPSDPALMPCMAHLHLLGLRTGGRADRCQLIRDPLTGQRWRRCCGLPMHLRRRRGGQALGTCTGAATGSRRGGEGTGRVPWDGRRSKRRGSQGARTWALDKGRVHIRLHKPWQPCWTRPPPPLLVCHYHNSRLAIKCPENSAPHCLEGTIANHYGSLLRSRAHALASSPL